MTGEFRTIIEVKLKALGKTLCSLVTELGIVPAFMSDGEKGCRYPPEKRARVGESLFS